MDNPEPTTPEDALRQISRLCGYEGDNIATPDAVVRMVQGAREVASRRHQANRNLSGEIERLERTVERLGAELADLRKHQPCRK